MTTANTETDRATEAPASVASTGGFGDLPDLPREELYRRIRNQAETIGQYAACLNDIPEIQHIPGGCMDDYRSGNQIRRIVEMLVAHCPLTWERDWRGAPKTSLNTVDQPPRSEA